MADDGAAQSPTVWPLPKFRFEVKWDAAVMHFQEVSGLDMEAQAIEYRHGDSPAFGRLKDEVQHHASRKVLHLWKPHTDN